MGQDLVEPHDMVFTHGRYCLLSHDVAFSSSGRMEDMEASEAGTCWIVECHMRAYQGTKNQILYPYCYIPAYIVQP